MRDKNARRWLWLAMILALLVGLACEGEDGAAPNTGEGRVDKTKSITLQNTGKGRTRDGRSTAYHVVLRIRNTKTDTEQTVRKDLVGDRFAYNIDYTAGTRLHIRLKVYGGANDVFDCKIYDGPDNQNDDHGLAQAYCELFTAR